MVKVRTLNQLILKDPRAKRNDRTAIHRKVKIYVYIYPFFKTIRQASA